MLFNFRFLTLLLSLGLLISCTSVAQKSDVSVSDFEKAINMEKVQLLDVRTSEEYDNGHLKNALQANWNNEAEFKKRVASLDKNIPVYTYCLSGARSGAAAAWLNANGYTAYNMQGGIAKWNAAGKALEQIKAVKQLTMEEFSGMIPKDKTVLVDFGAVWCPPCKKMEIVLADLQAKYGDSFMLVKIDAGINKNIAEQLQVAEFPTLLLYKEGKQVWKKEGLSTLEEIKNQL
ncbi:MAG: thioredoxin [Chitinophagaceae bacterium]|nr:MAG: thioredoxin [Chitinophagaceae bacterium]